MRQVRWVKNNSGIEKTWVGQVLSIGESYEIQPNEDLAWSNDPTVLADVDSGDIQVGKVDGEWESHSYMARQLLIENIEDINCILINENVNILVDDNFNITTGAGGNG